MGGLHLFANTRIFDRCCCGTSFFQKETHRETSSGIRNNYFYSLSAINHLYSFFQKSFRIFSSQSAAYLALQGQWPHLRLSCAQMMLMLEVWRMLMTERGSPSLHLSCVPASDSSPLSLVKLHISCYYHNHHHLHHFSSHY